MQEAYRTEGRKDQLGGGSAVSCQGPMVAELRSQLLGPGILVCELVWAAECLLLGPSDCSSHLEVTPEQWSSEGHRLAFAYRGLPAGVFGQHP